MPEILGTSKSISGFDPRSIGTCKLWLDGSDPAGTGIAPANASSVSTWVDKSGAGYNFTASSAATYNSTFKAVQFNNNLYSSSYPADPAAETIFIVANPTVITGAGALISGYSGARGVWVGNSGSGSGSAGVVNTGIVWLAVTPSGSVAINTTVLVTEQINAGTSYISLNGSTTVYTGGTGFSSATVTYLGRESGSSFGYVGYAMEIIVYNSYLPASERQTVEGYLAWKWGLQIIPVLPTTHPFYYIRPFSRYFNPTDIPDCILWLDGADTTTMIPSNPSSGTSITSWRDKSSNGVVYSSGVIPNYTAYSAASPVYVTGGGLNFNPSTPAGGTFTNGVSQSLNTVGGFPLNVTGFTAFAIAKATGTMTSYNAYFAWSSSVEFMSFDAFGGLSALYTDSGGLNTVAASTTLGTSTQIQTLRSSTTGATFYVNGTLSNTTAFSYTQVGSSVASNFWIAGQAPGNRTFSGTIYELLLFNTALSTGQRQQIEGYLAQKWGISASLPTHPFKTFPPSTVIPFLPTNISGCALWLDGADTTSMTISTLDISTWRDKSGNNYDAISQLTPATIVASSFGGNTSVLFNGASRYYCTTPSMSNGGYTVFTVQNTTSIAGGGSSGGYQLSFAAANLGVVVGVSNGYAAAFTDPGSGFNDLDALSPLFYNVSNNAIVSISVSNTVLTPYVNGSVGATKTGTTGAFSSFYIGNEGTGTSPWYGNICEIIFYNGILTTNQRQQVEGYLAWKWGLVSSLTSVTKLGLAYHLDAGNTASYPGSGTTWTDLVGTGVAMTLTNGPSYSSAVGGSIVFTPGSSHYAATASEFQSAAYTTFTVEVWISPSGAYTGTAPAIVTQKYPSTVNYVLGRVPAPGVGLGFFNGAWHSSLPSPYSLTTNTWAHVVGTYDGAYLKLYVNGGLQLSDAETSTPTWANNGGIYLMRRWDNPDYFGGSLAVVRIYNRALSGTEIYTNFSAQRARFGI